MQTGSAKTWHNYVVALMYKGQQLFSTSDKLLKEIDRKSGDMDKRTTQSLKIRTIQQGDRSADEHVQEFDKAALEAGYKGYPLIVEFKHTIFLHSYFFIRSFFHTLSPYLLIFLSSYL